MTVSDSCGSYTRSINVKVAPVLTSAATLDDYEFNRTLTYKTVSGTLNQSAANPTPNTVNSSAVVARYTRNATQLYDVLTAATTAIPDASSWLKGTRAFFMDVYTDAPVGTTILAQLENGSVATASNFPAGRHSKYVATSGPGSA